MFSVGLIMRQYWLHAISFEMTIDGAWIELVHGCIDPLRWQEYIIPHASVLQGLHFSWIKRPLTHFISTWSCIKKVTTFQLSNTNLVPYFNAFSQIVERSINLFLNHCLVLISNSLSLLCLVAEWLAWRLFLNQFGVAGGCHFIHASLNFFK